MMGKWQNFIGLAGLVLAGCVPLTQVWDSAPILQIDSGGHTSLIKDIAFTKDGRFLVSASNDKQVRVWNLETGNSKDIIRGQIGKGHEGKIFAMALSPDNRYLAVGGWMDSYGESTAPCCGDIRLYDFASGKLLALLTGHTSVVHALAFSADSRWLVSGGGDQSAIVWDIAQRGPVQHLTGHTDHIYAVAFTPDSQRVVTGSYDYTLKLWRHTDGELIETMRGHENKVYAVAVTPDGEILSGSADNSIRRWDGRTGASRGVLVADQGAQIGSLSVSADGRYVLAGVAQGSDTHLYRLSDGERVQLYQGHDNVVIATSFSPNGRWAATAGGADNGIHLWNVNTGKLEKLLAGGGQPVWAVGFSADGRRLAWGKSSDYQSHNQRGPLEYQIQLPNLNQPMTDPVKLNDASGFIRARPQLGSRRLQHQRGGSYGVDAVLAILQDDETLAQIERGSTNGYIHRAYTFTPNGKHIISGGAHGVLTLYDSNGKKQGNFVGHTGDIWSVAVSPDGRLLASGSADQTVRLWRIETQELLLSLFHAEGGAWVAWTPQGYFAASPDGEDMIGWQINLKPDQAADYASGRQLRMHFYRPDIVEAAIWQGSAIQAVEQATDTNFDLADLLNMLPPEFKIVHIDYPEPGEPPYLLITLKINPDTQVDTLRVYLDGRYVQQIATRSVLRIKSKTPIKVPLPSRAPKKIEVVAANQSGETRAVQDVPQSLDRPPPATRTGDLYLLSIGVNDYPFLPNDLRFASRDARLFHQQIQQGISGFRKVHEWLLVDGQAAPTRRNIQDKLAYLRRNVTANDSVIVFLAGHGQYQGGQYYFLGQDAQLDQQKLIAQTAVHWQDIQQTLAGVLGQRILIVDTCHAEGAFNPRWMNDAKHENISFFSSTDDQSLAEELPDKRHGAMTFALLEGLRGKADSYTGDGGITLDELEVFVRKRVMALTAKRQRPKIVLGDQATDFVIARKPAL